MNKTNLHIEVGNIFPQHKHRVVIDCTLSSKEGSAAVSLKYIGFREFDTLYMKIKFDEHDKRLQKSYSTKCVKRNGDFLVVGGTEARSKDVREGYGLCVHLCGNGAI